ncbi:hypothetical protein [Sclerotinia sclerotiorum megabirnavirus 1]|uniref:Peptidase C7 domain-containing protein n=1 Tax=Sclerotinia sclerotiorum megabirnavirus 1 TaxID=1661257 RepID=A0A0G3FEM8_9VIRU|nr:hypothetical protein [Sclerotinia sclerotiorum megabirnavirus 1]AKJ87316.1 hypothetical protein [Sclerotinia sclerotiorum megabirnavirus 1]
MTKCSVYNAAGQCWSGLLLRREREWRAGMYGRNLPAKYVRFLVERDGHHNLGHCSLVRTAPNLYHVEITGVRRMAEKAAKIRLLRWFDAHPDALIGGTPADDDLGTDLLTDAEVEEAINDDLMACRCAIHVDVDAMLTDSEFGCANIEGARHFVLQSPHAKLCTLNEAERGADQQFADTVRDLYVDPNLTPGSRRDVLDRRVMRYAAKSRRVQISNFGKGYCYLHELRDSFRWRSCRALGPLPTVRAYIPYLKVVGKKRLGGSQIAIDRENKLMHVCGPNEVGSQLVYDLYDFICRNQYLLSYRVGGAEQSAPRTDWDNLQTGESDALLDASMCIGGASGFVPATRNWRLVLSNDGFGSFDKADLLARELATWQYSLGLNFTYAAHLEGTFSATEIWTAAAHGWDKEADFDPTVSYEWCLNSDGGQTCRAEYLANVIRRLCYQGKALIVNVMVRNDGAEQHDAEDARTVFSETISGGQAVVACDNSGMCLIRAMRALFMNDLNPEVLMQQVRTVEDFIQLQADLADEKLDANLWYSVHAGDTHRKSHISTREFVCACGNLGCVVLGSLRALSASAELRRHEFYADVEEHAQARAPTAPTLEKELLLLDEMTKVYTENRRVIMVVYELTSVPFANCLWDWVAAGLRLLGIGKTFLADVRMVAYEDMYFLVNHPRISQWLTLGAAEQAKYCGVLNREGTEADVSGGVFRNMLPTTRDHVRRVSIRMTPQLNDQLHRLWVGMQNGEGSELVKKWSGSLASRRLNLEVEVKRLMLRFEALGQVAPVRARVTDLQGAVHEVVAPTTDAARLMALADGQCYLSAFEPRHVMGVRDVLKSRPRIQDVRAMMAANPLIDHSVRFNLTRGISGHDEALWHLTRGVPGDEGTLTYSALLSRLDGLSGRLGSSSYTDLHAVGRLIARVAHSANAVVFPNDLTVGGGNSPTWTPSWYGGDLIVVAPNIGATQFNRAPLLNFRAATTGTAVTTCLPTMALAAVSAQVGAALSRACVGILDFARQNRADDYNAVFGLGSAPGVDLAQLQADLHELQDRVHHLDFAGPSCLAHVFREIGVYVPHDVVRLSQVNAEQQRMLREVMDGAAGRPGRHLFIRYVAEDSRANHISWESQPAFEIPGIGGRPPQQMPTMRAISFSELSTTLLNTRWYSWERFRAVDSTQNGVRIGHIEQYLLDFTGTLRGDVTALQNSGVVPQDATVRKQLEEFAKRHLTQSGYLRTDVGVIRELWLTMGEIWNGGEDGEIKESDMFWPAFVPGILQRVGALTSTITDKGKAITGTVVGAISQTTGAARSAAARTLDQLGLLREASPMGDLTRRVNLLHQAIQERASMITLQGDVTGTANDVPGVLLTKIADGVLPTVPDAATLANIPTAADVSRWNNKMDPFKVANQDHAAVQLAWSAGSSGLPSAGASLNVSYTAPDGAVTDADKARWDNKQDKFTLINNNAATAALSWTVSEGGVAGDGAALLLDYHAPAGTGEVSFGTRYALANAICVNPGRPITARQRNACRVVLGNGTWRDEVIEVLRTLYSQTRDVERDPLIGDVATMREWLNSGLVDGKGAVGYPETSDDDAAATRATMLLRLFHDGRVSPQTKIDMMVECYGAQRASANELLRGWTKQ